MASIAELQAELDQVNAAIARRLSVGGDVEEYSTTIGNSARKVSLNDLRALRTELNRRIARLSRGRFALARRGVVR